MSVSKSGSTRVATSKFLAITEKLGLVTDTRAGWILAFAPGSKTKRLLIHTGKRGTNCIELVGFESPHAISHPCPPAKTMVGATLIDMNTNEKEILRNFFKTAKLLSEMVASSPVTKEEAPLPASEQPNFDAILAAVG
jgi:hypothetical protein